ncbi:putative monooxygenase [Nemania diffusa]|nr:putative monooxygenase [Nemania diffusa]
MATPFRAIIVGSGLVGLTAAHVFSKAGIDFIILEKHDDPLSTYGSTLAFWPQTIRIFDQLGLLDAAQPILDHCNEIFVLSSKDAQIQNKDRTMEYVKKNHGYGIRIMHRPDMIKFLYESLPDSAKAKILLKKRVTNISVSENAVTVFCADGTSQIGSIVIGADGVRSQTRLIMRAIKLGKQPDDLSESEKSPYTPTYRVYFGMCPILPGLRPNTRYDGSGNRVSTQIVNGTDKSWYGVYEQIDSPTWERNRYTEADKKAVLQRRSSLYMAPGWRLADVDSQRIGQAALIDLEEGLVDEWFHQRMVLVGDAVRKLEPHAGLGYNSGVTDLVVLVNGLRRLLQTNRSPSTRDLDELFQAYQAERADDTQEMERISMKSARFLAWPTWKHKMMATYIIPYFPLGRINLTYVVGPFISSTPVLEWLAERPLPASALPWKTHPIPRDDNDIPN